MLRLAGHMPCPPGMQAAGPHPAGYLLPFTKHLACPPGMQPPVPVLQDICHAFGKTCCPQPDFRLHLPHSKARAVPCKGPAAPYIIHAPPSWAAGPSPPPQQVTRAAPLQNACLCPPGLQGACPVAPSKGTCRAPHRTLAAPSSRGQPPPSAPPALVRSAEEAGNASFCATTSTITPHARFLGF